VAQFELSETAQHWVNVALIWIGFGILAGLLAKALIPGRQPAGAFGTLLIGVVGSVVGPLALCLYSDRPGFNPISPLGFLAAVGGALAALVAYRVVVLVVHTESAQDAE
jgi:uncharacterized membrane protein YeaQ/YmgE (transglycosylase-associated protein family)